MTISDTDPVYAEPHEARTIHLPEMPPIPTRVEGCDAPDGPVYYDPHRGVTCRCIVCGRCGHHTGNSNQGHYWALCHVTRKTEEFHFCCPDDCELHPIETAAGVQSTAAPADGKTVRGLPASGPARVEAGGPAVELRERLIDDIRVALLPYRGGPFGDVERSPAEAADIAARTALESFAGWLRTSGRAPALVGIALAEYLAASGGKRLIVMDMADAATLALAAGINPTTDSRPSPLGRPATDGARLPSLPPKEQP